MVCYICNVLGCRFATCLHFEVAWCVAKMQWNHIRANSSPTFFLLLFVTYMYATTNISLGWE